MPIFKPSPIARQLMPLLVGLVLCKISLEVQAKPRNVRSSSLTTSLPQDKTPAPDESQIPFLPQDKTSTGNAQSPVSNRYPDAVAQVLPSDLQERVDKGAITREEAQLLNSARGLPSPTPAKNTNNSSKKDTPNSDLQSGKVDFGPYIAGVKRKIRQNWKPPASDVARHTLLNFSISRSGELNKLQIKESSGLVSMDQAALDAVQKSAPFSPLPADYRGSGIEINFALDVNMNKDSN